MVSRLSRVAAGHPGAGVPELVAGARRGDQESWNALVERFSGLIWSIARGFGMNRTDAGEVTQTTWLRLAEHLAHIDHPDRLAAWLATTARRECLRVLREGQRCQPYGDAVPEEAVIESAFAERLIRAERDEALWRSFSRLRSSDQALLRLLTAEPAMSY
ncbi:MAG: sigma-70 family RNA polymerase sigma factor, partial [Actinobacteria bacterium]|nr:sigma-70 family RNA polymerase sigma factor [Actinomycetota bacterium]